MARGKKNRPRGKTAAHGAEESLWHKAALAGALCQNVYRCSGVVFVEDQRFARFIRNNARLSRGSLGGGVQGVQLKPHTEQHRTAADTNKHPT